MTIEAQYAHALRALIREHPEKSKQYLENLSKVLKAKGHRQLLSRIFAEYRSLEEREKRGKQYMTETPEGERTRILAQLYRKLVTS